MSKKEQNNESAEMPEEVDAENQPPEEATLEERASYEELLKELNEAQAQVNAQMDAVLRARAEVDNIRRRSADDVKKAHKFGNERLVKELLPVLDSLERSLEHADSEDEIVKNIHHGVELTYQMFLQALEKVEVQQINPLHDDFNPDLHEAVATEKAEEVKANSIIKVLQYGYTLHGRLIRPALVVVAA